MSKSLPARQATAIPARAMLEDPYRLATEALELSRQHETPPVPDTFKVWYTYASGKSAILNERIEALIACGSSPSVYDISNLSEEIVDAGTQMAVTQNETQESLRAEIDEVQKFIRGYIQSTERYQGAIDNSTKSLSEASTAAEVEVIIALMIRENQRIRAQTRQLSDSLQETQEEIVRLQGKLNQSQEAEQQDPMTGLPNRRFFQNAISTAVAQAEENDGMLAFALADIDHFKTVNDNFGHQIGDEILKFVGTFISDKIGPKGSVSRYGGEEFAIILPDIALADAQTMLCEIREGLAAARLVTSKTRKPIGSVTVSFGVAQHEEGDTIATLFERADRKLYDAKEAGRNRVM